jgi:hypothetical protein
MKRILILIVLLFVTIPVFAQEHAPSVEQCRADASVWAKEDMTVPSMDVLWAQAKEMSQCQDVDPFDTKNTDSYAKYFVKYGDVIVKVAGEYHQRIIHFLESHVPSWKKQFDLDDSIGKR